MKRNGTKIPDGRGSDFAGTLRKRALPGGCFWGFDRNCAERPAGSQPTGQILDPSRRRYWNENIGFYTTAYRRLTHSADFPTFSDGQLVRLFSASPMVGLSAELFIRRFIDHQSKWRRNELIDMLHLSSAAEYAKYVCAEAHTGTQLRDAQRALGRSETVFTTLDELVTAIRRDGARAESERPLHPPKC